MIDGDLVPPGATRPCKAEQHDTCDRCNCTCGADRGGGINATCSPV